MDLSKSKKSKSRRSSILKARKPRQPLQNVNFDSSSDENSPKAKRRVSFAEKKHVKEFCHSTEQGTVWDNTYEEHDDFSSKGSLIVDQNAEVESNKSSSLCASNNTDRIDFRSESNLCFPNNASPINGQLLQGSMTNTNEEDNDSNLDFTNPVTSMKLSNISQLEYASSNESLVSKAPMSNAIVAYSDTDEEKCMKLSDEESRSQQAAITNVSRVIKNVKSSNITIYLDSDEEDHADNIVNKCSKSPSNNINSELNKTCNQDLSMELTVPVCVEEQKRRKSNDINNLDENCIANCNNVSMENVEATSIFTDLSMELTVPICAEEQKRRKSNDINNLDENCIANCNNVSMENVEATPMFTDLSMELTVPVCAEEQKRRNKNDINNLDENCIANCNNVSIENVKATPIFTDLSMELTVPICAEEQKRRNKNDINNLDENCIANCKNVSMENVEATPIFTESVLASDLGISKQIPTISQKCENTKWNAANTCNATDVNYANDAMELTSVVQTFRNVADTCTNNTAFDTSMEMISVPSEIYEKNICNIESIVGGNDPRKDQTDKTEDNLDHSLNTNFEDTGDKKRISDELCSKRVSNSSIEVQPSQENKVYSFFSTNANCVNDIECNESFIKDVDYTCESDSNLKDHLNEISAPSFLTENLDLENSFVELQSIKSPSLECLDNKKENSSDEISSTPIIDTPIDNASNQLIINNATESNYLKEKLINIGNIQTEDHHRNMTVDKTEDNQRTNCQTITKMIINDNRSNESNYRTTKNIDEESILMNAKDGKIPTAENINHCVSIVKEIVITEEEDQERERTRKRINEDITLNDVKKIYLEEGKRETGKCSDHLESTGAIVKDQMYSEECRKRLNDEVKQQSMEEKDECTTERLAPAPVQCINTNKDVENKLSTEEDLFLTLSQKLETYSASDDCIWNVYYKNINRKMIVFGFISNSLLIATFLSYNFDGAEENSVKEIKIVSRISDETGILIRIVHKLILEKINVEILTKSYKNHQDILPMLDFITQEVKLAMDFMFDLRRLDNINLMDILDDEISFISQSKRLDIILRVTIKVKRFDEITSNDISVHCMLGKIEETYVKTLIKNVKKDHKFLRRYMKDVKDYIDIMEET